MPVIETRGLTKDFGKRKGIFDLDLKVEAGTIHGFLGPNGAGKSTTIRLLLDFLRPTYGQARVFGRNTRTDSLGIRRRIGYLPGEISLPGHLTGRRFLDDSAGVRGGVDLRFRRQLVKSLSAEIDRPIRTLSKGNKQKLAFIDAVQHRPPLLILDEPTDGLDPVLRHSVHDLLREIADDGGTVFLSSHVVHEIQTTCDKVSIVINGRLRHSDTIANLLAEEPTRIMATLPSAKTSLSPISKLTGIKDLQRSGRHLRFLVKGSLLPAMQALNEIHATGVKVRQHDLEETFLRLYQDEGPPT